MGRTVVEFHFVRCIPQRQPEFARNRMHLCIRFQHVTREFQLVMFEEVLVLPDGISIGGF